MKTCIKCQESIEIETRFCPKCGLDQNQITLVASSSFLITLCILTIVGSVITIGRALLYEIVASAVEQDYYRGWIYFWSSGGTLIGAIMMLQKKINGLYVYSISQVIYLITIVVASFSYGDVSAEIAFFVAMCFFLPSLVMLYLYWLKVVRQHLN
ncbi:zinc ribbon domain-containing protein [Fulvivirga marina]|nr:zinc ribbon domain-containing protein [Fulvivirga marina]